MTFLILVGFSIFVASRDITNNKLVSYLLPILGIGILVTSNLYWIALFYIHTNLDTGLSLFLVVIALYFAIRQMNDAWFGVAAIFMILLGLTRSENVILAALVIILTVSTFDISHRKLLWTFLPYLIIQIVWNMAIIYINQLYFQI